MNGIENLRVPTSEEAREYGRKGGINSGKSRRERKLIAEYLESLMQTSVVDDRIIREMERRGVKRRDRNYAAAVALATMGKALKGDINATKLILSVLGEMPKEITDVNMSVSNEPKVILEDFDDGRGGYE